MFFKKLRFIGLLVSKLNHVFSKKNMHWLLVFKLNFYFIFSQTKNSLVESIRKCEPGFFFPILWHSHTDGHPSTRGINHTSGCLWHSATLVHVLETFNFFIFIFMYFLFLLFFIFFFIWLQVWSLEKEDTPQFFSSRVFLIFYSLFGFFIFGIFFF